MTIREKPYKHDKGVFLVTQLNDNGNAVSQFVDCVKLSPASAFDASMLVCVVLIRLLMSTGVL